MITIDIDIVARAMKRIDKLYKDEMEYVDGDIQKAMKEEVVMLKEVLKAVLYDGVDSK